MERNHSGVVMASHTGACVLATGAAPYQPWATPYQPGAMPYQPGATPYQLGATSYQLGATLYHWRYTLTIVKLDECMTLYMAQASYIQNYNIKTEAKSNHNIIAEEGM